MNEFYLYLPHPGWWLSSEQRPPKFRSLQLRLRVDVYLEAVKTMSSTIAAGGDTEACQHCSLLLQQTMRHISYYFALDEPHVPEKWCGLHEAMHIEAAWCSDSVVDWIWQRLQRPYPQSAAAADEAKNLLQRIGTAGEEDKYALLKEMQGDYEGRDAIVTIDELMTLVTNIPPRTIELHYVAANNHIEQCDEGVDSIQYLYRCMSPPYLKMVANRIVDETLEAMGGYVRGMKSQLAASIIYVERLARLSSIRRKWLPKSLQPLYAPETLNAVRRTLNEKPTIVNPNMAMATAILASAVAKLRTF